MEKKFLKTLQKKQKEIRVENSYRKKVINFMLNGKATIVRLINGLIKMTKHYEWIFSRTNIFGRKSES